MYLILLLLLFLSDWVSTETCRVDSVNYISKIKNFLIKHKIKDSINHKIQYESCNLMSIGIDVYGREQFLSFEASKAFEKMKSDAKMDKIDINFISAFRSFDAQANIIERKIKKGYSKERIFNENMYPGYSEHHTGNAIDIVAKNTYTLNQEFENSEVFKWLIGNASRYNFFLTYPKNNIHGIMYEPWHWVYIDND